MVRQVLQCSMIYPACQLSFPGGQRDRAQEGTRQKKREKGSGERRLRVDCQRAETRRGRHGDGRDVLTMIPLPIRPVQLHDTALILTLLAKAGHQQ